MKKLIALILTPVFLGLCVWAFLEGRKEMQKERDRERPVQGEPRIKKVADGSSVIEFNEETLRLSGVASENLSGPIRTDAIVMADGNAWYFAEIREGVFQRKRCVSPTCPVTQERVVVRGAQILLSEERKDVIRIGEEGGGG